MKGVGIKKAFLLPWERNEWHQARMLWRCDGSGLRKVIQTLLGAVNHSEVKIFGYAAKHTNFLDPRSFSEAFHETLCRWLKQLFELQPEELAGSTERETGFSISFFTYS